MGMREDVEQNIREGVGEDIEQNLREGVRADDEPWYCNKNVATPKDTNFNYQSKVLINLRGVNTICST